MPVDYIITTGFTSFNNSVVNCQQFVNRLSTVELFFGV
jgi:hypothetical protein